VAGSRRLLAGLDIATGVAARAASVAGALGSRSHVVKDSEPPAWRWLEEDVQRRERATQEREKAKQTRYSGAWHDWEDELLERTVDELGSHWDVIRDSLRKHPEAKSRNRHRNSRQCYERHRKLVAARLHSLQVQRLVGRSRALASQVGSGFRQGLGGLAFSTLPVPEAPAAASAASALVGASLLARGGGMGLSSASSGVRPAARIGAKGGESGQVLGGGRNGNEAEDEDDEDASSDRRGGKRRRTAGAASAPASAKSTPAKRRSRGRISKKEAAAEDEEEEEETPVPSGRRSRGRTPRKTKGTGRGKTKDEEDEEDEEEGDGEL